MHVKNDPLETLVRRLQKRVEQKASILYRLNFNMFCSLLPCLLQHSTNSVYSPSSPIYMLYVLRHVSFSHVRLIFYFTLRYFLCVLFLHYCFRRWLWWWSVLSLPSPLSLSLLSALVNVVVFLLIFVLININKTIARCAVNLCVQMYTVTWWHAKGQKKCDR